MNKISLIHFIDGQENIEKRFDSDQEIREKILKNKGFNHKVLVHFFLGKKRLLVRRNLQKFHKKSTIFDQNIP